MDEKYFELARQEAVKAGCLRDKCGAVVVMDCIVVGAGYNGPPSGAEANRKCDLELTSSSKPKADRTCCVHAEWRAIIDAIQNKKDITGSTLYFTRVDNAGVIKKSGQPYCTVCSRLALDTGVRYFALWQEEGIKLFDTKDYNDLSYKFHN